MQGVCSLTLATTRCGHRPEARLGRYMRRHRGRSTRRSGANPGGTWDGQDRTNVRGAGYSYGRTVSFEVRQHGAGRARTT